MCPELWPRRKGTRLGRPGGKRSSMTLCCRSVQSLMIVKVGPFCRKGLSPQGELPWEAHPLHVAAWLFLATQSGRWSRRGREVLLGKQDLPNSAKAPAAGLLACLLVTLADH